MCLSILLTILLQSTYFNNNNNINNNSINSIALTPELQNTAYRELNNNAIKDNTNTNTRYQPFLWELENDIEYVSENYLTQWISE